MNCRQRWSRQGRSGDREKPLPDLACEGPGSLGVAVLSRDLDVFAQKVEDGDEVQGRGGDDDLCDLRL